MSAHTDDHNAYIGRAFNRRKQAQAELDDLATQAVQVGTSLAELSRKLLRSTPGRVTEDGDTLVTERDETWAVPQRAEIAVLINRMEDLRAEIAELNTILA